VGLLMNTKSVKNQLKQMSRNLEEMILNAQLMIRKIDAFIDTPELLAQSYGNLKGYYNSVHIPVLRGLICCAEDLAAENEAYSALIDTYLADAANVDEDGLLEDVERIGMILRILEDTPPGVTTMLDLRQTLENQKADIEEKLERISQFVSCASALYSGNDGLKVQLLQGLGIMQGIQYNSAGRMFQISGIDMEWSRRINEMWGNRQEMANVLTDVLAKIKKENPKMSDDDICKIVNYMVQNPIREEQSLEEYLAEHKEQIELLGIGWTVASQAFSTTCSALGEITKAQGVWLAENAAKILSYSQGSVDDMLRYSDDIIKAAQVGTKGTQISNIGGAPMTVIGSGIDYGLLRAGGADKGEALIKTGAHTAIGCMAGTAVKMVTTAMVASSAGGPVGLVIGVSVIVTVVLVNYFDYMYDNNKTLQDTGEFIDKKLDDAGRCINDFSLGTVVFE
jgi:hypothetical protein